MRLGVGFRALFRVLGDTTFADRVERLLTGDEPAGAARADEPQGESDRGRTRKPSRSEALTLLATLQREARLLDFLMEDLTGYQDAQIGAAARDVHRESAAVLQRLFGPKPLRSEDENSILTVPPGADPAHFHLTGNVAGEPPYTGVLRHHGWRASRCELPAWTGSEDAALAIAPAEVELK